MFLRLLSLAVTLLTALPAFGQYTRDASAQRKIDEAVNQHYLATDFDKAEGILTGTVKACEDKCSPQTLARAWMYVGIVRGSGRNDIAGAKEAFRTAASLDPNVKLDAALATAETQAAFAEATSGGAAEAPTAPAAPSAGGGEMTCTPEVTEVETRRPIPVECTSDEELTNVELRYRPFGSDTWKTLKMSKVGDGFRATIPCADTQVAGTLRLYVRGRDASGNDVANWGSKGAPVEITFVEQSNEDPPAFSGAEPPERCPAEEICPPDFPGCDSGKKSGGSLDWGASCNNSSECKAGLLCIDGTCESAPSCTTDSDCPVGTCDGGKCTAGSGDDDSPGVLKKWWLGLHVAQDFAIVSGQDVCLNSVQESEHWACYLSSDVPDAPYDSEAFGTPKNGGGAVNSGSATGPLRFLLSIEHALTNNITAGLRLGWAINGGPPEGKKVEYTERTPGMALSDEYDEVDAGKAFLPFHAELRGTYYFGSNPLARKGFRPYLHVGAGLAQVDARVIVKVKDHYNPNDPSLQDGQVNAWKKLGQGFLTAGGGLQFALSSRFALQANLNAMFMLPMSGFVLQPSIGAAYGAF